MRRRKRKTIEITEITETTEIDTLKKFFFNINKFVDLPKGYEINIRATLIFFCDRHKTKHAISYSPSEIISNAKEILNDMVRTSVFPAKGVLFEVIDQDIASKVNKSYESKIIFKKNQNGIKESQGKRRTHRRRRKI